MKISRLLVLDSRIRSLCFVYDRYITHIHNIQHNISYMNKVKSLQIFFIFFAYKIKKSCMLIYFNGQNYEIKTESTENKRVEKQQSHGQ